MPVFANGTGTITVTDSNGGTAEVTVSITITGIVEAPDVSAMSADVQENDMSGPNLLEVSSPDTGVTFSVDNDKFEIDTVGSASVLKLKDGMYLDHEGTGGMVTLMITATDGMGNASMSTEVTINVGDVNEAPMISVMDGDNIISEDTTGTVASFMVSDPEQAFTADDITVSDDRFGVMAGENGFMLVLNEHIDADTEDSVTVTVGVVDEGGRAASAAIDVTIAGVNEVPTVEVADAVTPDGKAARAVIGENQTGPVGLITVTDQEEDLDASHITLSDDRFGTDTDAAGGIWLVLNEAVDFEEVGSSISVTVTVTDSDGLPAMVDVDVEITDVNEMPTIEFDGDTETPEGMAVSSTVMEHVGDGEFMPVPVGEIKVSDPEQMLTEDDLMVSDSRFGLHTDALGGIWLMLNEAIDAEGEEKGMVMLTVTATDAGELSASTEVMVTIENVNEAPMIELVEGFMPDADGKVGASGTLSENATGPAYQINVSDPEEMITEDHVMVDDDRFEVKTDSEGGLWVFLREEVNYEEVSSIDITVTVTDSEDLSAKASRTVTIRDENDNPTANQDGILREVGEGKYEVQGYVEADASTEIDVKLDLGSMFSDEDGDTNFRYIIENAPSWLQLVNVQYGDDGMVTGELKGTPPAGLDIGSNDIRIIAEDEEGGRAHVTFDVIVDDGNDVITAVNLTNPDDTANKYHEVEIVENDARGVVLGTLTADDDDHDQHPNGIHIFELVRPDDMERFEIVKSGDQSMDDDGNYLNIEPGDTWTLKVKDGVHLDHEGNLESDPLFSVLVRAKEYILKDQDMLAPGFNIEDFQEDQHIFIDVIDQNDGPGENPVGAWWVTVDDDLDPEDAEAGSWLEFALETQADKDTHPLFTDQDIADGDELTYEIVGGTAAAWLEIDEETGVLRNKKETVPAERGVYTVMVQATDKAGEKSEVKTFKIAVALSDVNNDGEYTDNNEVGVKGDGDKIYEAGEMGAKPGDVVATFTIEDEDLDLEGIHPWSQHDITVTAMVDLKTDNTDDLVTIATFTPETLAWQSMFVLTNRQESSDGESVSYDIALTSRAFRAPTPIDHELYDEVEFTVMVNDRKADGTSLSDDSDDIKVDIEDVNEAPKLDRAGPHGEAEDQLSARHSSENLDSDTRGLIFYTVQQQQESHTVGGEDTGVHTIYLNLSRLFDDEDEDHDDKDLTFTANVDSGISWLKIASHWNSEDERFTRKPVKWEDIRDGQDEDPNTDDDIEWGAGDDYVDADMVGDDDWVLILEVNRTGYDLREGRDPRPDAIEIRQDRNESFTINAMDDDGASKSQLITVKIDDENLDPGADGQDKGEIEGVTLSDDTPKQYDAIQVTFDEDVDPDFTGPGEGSPVVTIYQVLRHAVDDDGMPTGDGAVVGKSLDSALKYTATQADVDMKLEGKVIYYELFKGSIARSVKDNEALEAMSDGLVEDRQDPATLTGLNKDKDIFYFTGNTESNNNRLVAPMFPVREIDGDSEARADANKDDAPFDGVEYVWEYSDSGAGGWDVFDADGMPVDEDPNTDRYDDSPDTYEAVIPGNLSGKYVRVVYVFEDDDGNSERVEGPAVKVGSIDTFPFRDGSQPIPAIDYGTLTTEDEIPVGRTVRIDANDVRLPGGSAQAVWLAGGKEVGRGSSYEIKDSDKGKAITVKLISYDGNGNVISIVDGLAGDGTKSVVGGQDRTGPSAIEESFTVDLGAAPAQEGVLAELMGGMTLKDLFEDVEEDLSFSFDNPEVRFTNTDSDRGEGAKLQVFFDENDGSGATRGDQLLILNEVTGQIHYYTTMSHDHGDASRDSTADDGAGNFVVTELTATDSVGSDDVSVRLRIDTAPTGFSLTGMDTSQQAGGEGSEGDGTDGEVVTAAGAAPNKPYDYDSEVTAGYVPWVIKEYDPRDSEQEDQNAPPELNPEYPFPERVDDQVLATQRIAAKINVLDENMGTHEYGQYDFEVITHSDLFEVVDGSDLVGRGEGAGAIASNDGSIAWLRLKAGAVLDFEEVGGRIYDKGTPELDDDTKHLIVTVKATPKSGNFESITIGILVEVQDDGVEPRAPGNVDVPGLKDIEGSEDRDPADDDTKDDEVSGEDDDDEDGGAEAPANAMASFVASFDDGLF